MKADSGKKFTKASLKAWVRKNSDNLYIKLVSKFDGMYDMVVDVDNGGFKKVPVVGDVDDRSTMGVQGAYFTGGGRHGDSITPYEKDGFKGYNIYNCCGEFILAVKEGR